MEKSFMQTMCQPRRTVPRRLFPPLPNVVSRTAPELISVGEAGRGVGYHGDDQAQPRRMGLGQVPRPLANDLRCKDAYPLRPRQACRGRHFFNPSAFLCGGVEPLRPQSAGEAGDLRSERHRPHNPEAPAPGRRIRTLMASQTAWQWRSRWAKPSHTLTKPC